MNFKKEDIIIHPADKVGSIVVMSVEHYDNSISSQLKDQACYDPLTRNPLEQFKEEIDQVLETSLSREWITQSEKDFLTVQHPNCPMFYGLPKIKNNCRIHL